MSASRHFQPLAPQPSLRVARDVNSLRRPVRPPTQSPTSRSTKHRPAPRRRKKQRPSRAGLAAETMLKLLVNGVLSAGTIFTLTSLFPYYWAQQAKLQEVRQQVQTTELEVMGLQEDFNRSFDPSQAQSVMQDQSGLLAPNQRRVVLTNQDPN
ncbi:MAG: hypothetical protein F6J87_21235 [Spirulina sp. SIO3F2]|nr:hypothetical protein [Spirulina sp. SIO3F2]